ncbi:hypothetical protein B0T10DRAFT_562350 [Thelonectria olida]|uniref:Uncharacterized protein n=1 Tax=Thelonectria olida TaxID=1576542 RepID=A0A9P9AKW8_9HYPO|nr:hypothetical protein B0T10DRAFT_562350 [Thelonectria olida]
MSAPVLALAIPAPITTPAPTPAPAPASSPTLAPPTPPTPAPLPPQPQPPSPLASPAPAAPASTVSAASSIRSDGVSSEHSGVQLNEDVGSIHTHEDETAPAPPASIDESDEVSFSDDDWVEIVTPHSTAASIRMVPAEPALVEARPSLSLSLATNASSSTVVASARGGEARLTPQTPASRSQASFQAFFQAAQAAQAAAHQNQANHNNQRQPAAVAQVQTRHKPKPQTQQTQPQTHSQSPQTKAQAQKSSQSSGSQTHTQTNTLTQRTKDMSLSSAHQQQPAPLPHQHRHQRQEPADDIPQRNSSFIGLPPIRRGSTFGMSSPSASTSHSQAARPTAERFPLDDDDEVPEERTPHPPHPAAIPGPVPAPAPPRLPGNTTVAGNGAIRPDGANFETSRLPLLPLLPLLPPQHTQQQGAAHPTQASRMPDQPVHMSPPPGPPEQSDPVRDPMHPHSPGSSEHHQSSSPFGGPAVAGSAASGSSSGAPPMMPPNSTGNPIQKLPPSGPWKLEESHLSEPLHSVSRNRAGTGSSQQQPYFGYDKETGVTLPSQGPPVVPPDTASSPRPRHKPSEVPPSSTRRYPELFARGDPRARSNSNVGPVLPSPQLASGRLSQDIGVPRAVTAGPETEGNGEERGRRKSSGGLFNRLTKPSSERRGSSSAEPIATPPHVPVGPADESSQSSIPIHEMHPDQRKPPRGSFLFSLRGRPSMDPPPQPQQAVQPPAPVQAPMQASVQAPVQAPMQAPPPIGQDQTRPETPQSQSERKHSRFGSGLGAITGGHKVKPTGLPRSSTSSMVNEPNSSAEHMAPPKKRFSGFGSKGGIFHRQSIDIVPKPGTPGSMRPSTGSATPDHVGSMAPPPPIGFMRSNTDGPGPFAQSTMQAQDLGGQDRRKRRGSAGGLISGFLGHSKKSQSQSGPIGPPQGQNQGMQPLPPGQNPLGQHPPGRSPLANPPMNQSQGQFDPRQAQGQFPPGHPGLQQNYQMQVSNGQPSGLAPQLPPLGPVSPVQLPGQMPWGQPSSGTPGQAPPPGQSSTHPPALRRMTGESLDSQLQPNTERPGSSGVNPPEQNREFGTAPEQNGSQVSLNQPRPSPLGQESPLVSKAAHAESSVHDSPRPSVNTTIPAPTDDASIHMRSGSRGVSPTRSVPLSHASNHTPKPSLDTTVQRGDVDTTEPQRPTMDSPSLSFRSAQPGHARTDSHNRDELPLSPVSQLSRTGPPSIASSNLGQSPRLASAAATVTGRGSQPGTPLLSMTSNTPPMQNQGFAPRMAPPPQQHSTPSSPLQQQQHQHHQDLQSPNLQQHQQPQPSFSPTPQQQQQQQQQRQQSPTSPFQQQGQQQRQPLASPFPQQQQQQQKPPPSPFQQQEQKALSSVAPPHQQSSASPFQQQGQRQQQQPPASPFQQQGQYQQQQPPSSPFQQQQQQRPPLSPFQQQGQQQQQVLPPPGLQQNRQQQQHQILGPQQNNAPSRTQSPSLQTRPSFQTMPSPSSQSSIPVSRPSLQMQRPPGSPMTPNPHGPPPAMMNPPVGQATSSKWKGLRNRMSAQMVAKPQHEQGKPKEKTSKLFGAFKRSSKSTPQQPQTPQVAQGQQGHQNLHGFFHPHHGHHPQGAPIQQQMYPPGQQMQPSQQMPPPGQQMALRQQVPPGQQMSPRQQMPPGQIRPGQPIAVGQQVPLGQRMPPPEQQMTPGQQVPPGQVRLSQQIMVGQQMPPPGQQMPPGQSSPDQKQMPQPQQMRPGQPIAPGQQQGAPGQQSALVQQPRPGQSSPIGQHAPPGQLPPGQQIRPGQQSPPIQQPQQFVGQVSHPQSYARRHASQLTSPSSGQKPLSPPTSTSPPMGQQPFSPVNSTVGQQPRPPAGQAVVGPRQGTPKGFQRPFQPQPQQQRPGQRFTEPQYDQVPIPQGYVAVHGEGVVVPSPYNVGRNLNHQSSFQHPPQQQAQPQMSQQVYSQPQSPASMASPSGLRGQPLSHPQTPMSHPTSPQNDGRVGIDPGYRTVQGETRPPATPRGGSIDDSWQAPPQVQRVATNASQVPPQVQRVATTASHASSHGSGTSSETPGNETPGHIVHMHSVSALGSETQSNGPRSPPPPSSENGFLKPQNATTPPSLSAGSITPSREPGSPVGNEQNGTREEYSRPISLSPPIGADDKASPSISHAYSTSAVSDEPNVVAKATKDKAQTSEDVGSDTNEGVRLHVTGESQRDVAHRQLSNGALMRSQTRNRGAPAELEDTEDAHARKMRLAGQEEKIHYDPDADSDGEPAPQMVATSYPGQEWNPYGMPEYGEWND